MEKILLTMQDVCDALSVSRRTVRQLMSRGYLPHRKIGRLTRFHRKDVEALAKMDLPNLGWERRPWPRDREKQRAAS